MEEKKILVVDDEDYQRDLMKKLLSKLGYTVKVVESPEQAFSILEREEFPVIITDLIMLEMDGVEFCRRIRESDSKTVIIALTGHSELYDLEKLKMAGFDGYLSKPIRIEVIQEAVENSFNIVQQRVHDQKETH